MGRFGFQPEEWERTLIAELQSLPGIRLTGLMSHLPSADEDEVFTQRQLRDFSQLVEKVPGLDAHIVNSAGLIAYGGEQIGNIVRPGLMLYGCSPVDAPGLDLHPVMSLKSRIAVVRMLPAGSGISYGRSYVTEKPMRVATVAVGYGDGYRRHVSGNGGEVAVRGQRCRILGRVTMDQIMIDVDHLRDVAAGDEVLLFGSSGPGDSVRISVEEVAQKAGSIPWEIFTGITPRVLRIPSVGTVVRETS
jgi:alanine racemase